MHGASLPQTSQPFVHRKVATRVTEGHCGKYLNQFSVTLRHPLRKPVMVGGSHHERSRAHASVPYVGRPRSIEDLKGPGVLIRGLPDPLIWPLAWISPVGVIDPFEFGNFETHHVARGFAHERLLAFAVGVLGDDLGGHLRVLLVRHSMHREELNRFVV